MPTCTVTCTIYDQSGEPEVGAKVRATLLGRVGGVAQGQYARVSGETGASGSCDLELLRETGGTTSYEVTLFGEKNRRFRTTATVPDQAAANLHEISEPLV